MFPRGWAVTAREAREVPRKQRKRKEPHESSETSEDDTQLRRLDTEIKWMSFLYHSWSSHSTVIKEVYGDALSQDDALWQYARTRCMDGVKRYKFQLIEKFIVRGLIACSITSCHSLLLQSCMAKELYSESQRRLRLPGRLPKKTSFFRTSKTIGEGKPFPDMVLYYYMEGVLASIAIPKGKYFLSHMWANLGCEVYFFLKGGSDKNARDALVKAYDAIPLSDNFSKIDHLSGLSRMEFTESPPRILKRTVRAARAGKLQLMTTEMRIFKIGRLKLVHWVHIMRQGSRCGLSMRAAAQYRALRWHL
ncbi:hypothetical protein V8E54_000085 [Elaphomyces granulatus]